MVLNDEHHARNRSVRLVWGVGIIRKCKPFVRVKLQRKRSIFETFACFSSDDNNRADDADDDDCDDDHVDDDGDDDDGEGK